MPSRGSKILDRFGRVANLRATFETNWQEISDHCTGRRWFIARDDIPGRIRHRDIYDNTSMVSGVLLASGLHTLLTNTATTWFRMKPEFDELLEDPETAIWFEDAEHVMYSHFNRPEARFMSQMHEMYHDLVHYGTSSMWVLDKPGQGVAFSARPLRETYITQDSEGVIDTYFRKLEMTNRQAVDLLGAKNVPRAAKEIENGNGEKVMEYLHWIRRNDDPDPAQMGSKGMPWSSSYIDFENGNILSEGGYRELPYLVARWSTDAGEVYGRGPGYQALPAQKMLNQMKRTVLEAGQLAVRPPAFVRNDGVLTQLRLNPGGVTYLGPDDGSGVSPITFMETKVRPDIGTELLERERVAVRGAYHFELLQLLQDPRMTATQVIELASKMSRLLSPILGRMQSEVLEPMIERVFSILLRQGRFLPPPPALQGQEIRVEYVSPIARAQREGDAAAIVDTFTVATNLATTDPGVMDNLNGDEAIREIARAKGVPLSVLRPQAEVAALREERNKQAQQQQALDQFSQAAGALPSLVESGIDLGNAAGNAAATPTPQ